MKKIIQGTLIVSSLILSAQVSANSALENNWSIGLGGYSFSLANEDNSNADIDFTGFSVSGAYAFTDYIQVRGTYFALENDEVSSLESKGADIMLYGGVGLSRKGFRGYGGAGFFSDKWTSSGNSESFSGVQLGGGLGYNWGDVAVDFVINLRQADKYEDFIFESGTYFAGSGNLSVSYLF